MILPFCCKIPSVTRLSRVSSSMPFRFRLLTADLQKLVAGVSATNPPEGRGMSFPAKMSSAKRSTLAADFLIFKKLAFKSPRVEANRDVERNIPVTVTKPAGTDAFLMAELPALPPAHSYARWKGSPRRTLPQVGKSPLSARENLAMGQKEAANLLSDTKASDDKDRKRRKKKGEEEGHKRRIKARGQSAIDPSQMDEAHANLTFFTRMQELLREERATRGELHLERIAEYRNLQRTEEQEGWQMFVQWGKQQRERHQEKVAAMRQAEAALQARSYEEATRWFTIALRLHPLNADLYSGRAAAHDSLQDYDEAVADAQKAAQLRPDWALAPLQLGAAFHHKNLRTQALEHYKQSLLFDPFNPACRHWLAEAEAQELLDKGTLQRPMRCIRRSQLTESLLSATPTTNGGHDPYEITETCENIDTFIAHCSLDSPAKKLSLLADVPLSEALWIDTCCIAQNPEAARQADIALLEGVLQKCSRAIVLYSPRFVNELWAVFQLAVVLCNLDPSRITVRMLPDEGQKSVGKVSVETAICQQRWDKETLKRKMRRIWGGVELFEKFSNALVLPALDLRGLKTYETRVVSEVVADKDCRLQTLQLAGRQIGDEGVATIAHSLRANYSVTSVNLSGNRIAGAAAAALRDALRENHTITSIDVSSTQLGPGGIGTVMQGLRSNSGLKNLNLCLNDIGEEGTRHLADALTVNPTVVLVCVTANELGLAAPDLRAVVKMRSPATVLDVSVYLDPLLEDEDNTRLPILQGESDAIFRLLLTELSEREQLSRRPRVHEQAAGFLEIAVQRLVAEECKEHKDVTVEEEDESLELFWQGCIASEAAWRRDKWREEDEAWHYLGHEIQEVQQITEAQQLRCVVREQLIHEKFFAELISPNRFLESQRCRAIDAFICHAHKDPAAAKHKALQGLPRDEAAAALGAPSADDMETFWVDVCCASRLSEAARAAGLANVERFIASSTKLVVLFTPKIVERLWCLFEIALFLYYHTPSNVLVLNLPAEDGEAPPAPSQPATLRSSVSAPRSSRAVSHFTPTLQVQLAQAHCSHSQDEALLRDKVARIWGGLDVFELYCQALVPSALNQGLPRLEALATALNLPSVGMAVLNLSHTRITPEEAALLCEALKTNQTITEVNLTGAGPNSSTGLGQKGAKFLADALRQNSTIRVLRLARNNLFVEGMRPLSEALKVNTAVVDIDLQDNSIGEKGATYLANTLKSNTAITRLNLAANKIFPSGAKVLGEALRANITLATLDMRTNGLGDNGAKTVAELLRRNTGITCIDLQDNYVRSVGLLALAAAIKPSTTLRTVTLVGNEFTQECAKALADAKGNRNDLIVQY
eukprot:TRINITY_DN789_c0_g2_i1.p1 TRINITY_DN789_c0_g2~~TRINITY_DN789_c0_g2_i1.p1  ORF type:complete len:1340 (+),score=235.65 TRINITY_DN789_c0_g2_i1:1389-5408(+)